METSLFALIKFSLFAMEAPGCWHHHAEQVRRPRLRRAAGDLRGGGLKIVGTVQGIILFHYFLQLGIWSVHRGDVLKYESNSASDYTLNFFLVVGFPRETAPFSVPKIRARTQPIFFLQGHLLSKLLVNKYIYIFIHSVNTAYTDAVWIL